MNWPARDDSDVRYSCNLACFCALYCRYHRERNDREKTEPAPFIQSMIDFSFFLGRWIVESLHFILLTSLGNTNFLSPMATLFAV